MSERGQDINDFSMLDLFRLEVETQATVLNEGLLTLETQTQSPQAIESSMRAAHAVKGQLELLKSMLQSS